MRQERSTKGPGQRFLPPLLALAGVVAAVLLLYFLALRPAYALEFFYYDTTLLDFNEGFLYHTALSWRDDGEIQLLPIGFPHPWEPGNNTGLPPRAGHAAVYYRDHLYVIAGDNPFGDTHNEVFYSTIISTLTHELSDWQQTMPLPATADFYPEGLYFHEAAVLNDYLYVFGGKEDEGAASTYYNKVVFAPINADGTLGDWQLTTPLPGPRFELESLVYEGRIYVIGGADEMGQSTETVWYTVPAADGQIVSWIPVTQYLPHLGQGGYVDASATLENGRIYVYGGASEVAYNEYSPYVHFAQPLTTTGDITDWTMAVNPLPFNCYASEGAAYQSGLLLAIAGAWNNGLQPSGDVRAALVDHDTGQVSEWVSTVALSPTRYYHAAIQDDYGWLYSIGGASRSGVGGSRLNSVDIASPYGGDGGPLMADQPLVGTTQTSATVYAPEGTFLSPATLVTPVEGRLGTLTSLSWNTTITDGSVMTVTMSYRYHEESGWTDWYGPYPSLPGTAVTTTLAISGTCDYFQYRAYLSSEISTTTPFLNLVRIGVLAPPDLVAEHLTVTGCPTCPGLIPPNKPVQIEFTVYNRSTDLEWNNNFNAMVFITTTPDPDLYPHLPVGCQDYPTVTCPLIWQCQALNFQYADPPVTLKTTYTFTTPGQYYLVAYVDYNDTPTHPPPAYDVLELVETNNELVLPIYVGHKEIYLPLIDKSWP